MRTAAPNTVRPRRPLPALPRADEPLPPGVSATALPTALPRPSPLGVLSKMGYWESRRLTFLRVSVAGGTDAEGAQRVAAQLELAADKLREFRGRIEGVSPRGVLAVFGVDPSD